MVPELTGQKIALLGGDAREHKLLSCLKKQDAKLYVVGDLPLTAENITGVENLAQLPKDLDAVIAPMTGIDEDYKIKKPFGEEELVITEEFCSQLKPGTKFFIGFAKPQLKTWCRDYNLKLVELAAEDEVAILNAIPTAEGALELAIRKSDLTLHGNNSFVLGLGRVGLTLARMLKGLGSNTYGVARKRRDLARAQEMGLIPVDFAELAAKINEADFIFNTVPALVLTEEILTGVNPQAVIIDLASAPGGSDFKVAQELGIDAELALGLPGKVAPDSAGQILAEVIPRYIVED
jgi:dipicolinate synthase subunit A